MRFHPNSLYQIKHQWMVSIEVVTMNDGGSTTEAKRIYKRQ
ncbi:unnamed protein product [Acanthoscelides obtectus]|uniref:Uncharacterized protein n=1 Tax=Acanthoscelides obtectus TaxID=200917 RepID=A0A9P0LY16_ACAOB|nr:unnamed protein product [Acanthoscelides obtectus]CAK1668572.1 hypothetical protein AOBTE_LOCUS26493 [Acanthoscelides obtectus]